MQQNSAIILDSLTKRYNARHGIHNINLDVISGEIFGFLGPNGAGKSTTINTMLDILRADEGFIRILGMDSHSQAKKIHQRVGYLSGDMETDPSLTGVQYLRFVANLHGNIAHERIITLADRLKADTATKIKHLSRGSKQKIGLIAALMHDPDILILDEPTSGLDPLMQAEFNTIIRERKGEGKTTFISSHVLSEIQSLCDRVGFIRGGKLIEVSTLSDLLQKAPRRITVHFKKETPTKSLQALEGVKNFRQEDGLAIFLYSGDMNILLKTLTEYSLQNLEIADADLEELFMSYYRNEENA
ncbi:ABC transporter ATP-binding protein [Streptomyces caniscabiei]|uniref:ABC transporter ATP-binding protein n=1 Tax=Streptomyces caniscabiei TaxID=2746961 RepID=UPI0029B5780C|nr:ABC transporter ATP-binding protein [Streptomyces caniscabiei]MDX2776134.1 ABC transporter ATP-binding protein [Streptomyces caniscabiei]